MNLVLSAWAVFSCEALLMRGRGSIQPSGRLVLMGVPGSLGENGCQTYSGGPAGRVFILIPVCRGCTLPIRSQIKYSHCVSAQPLSSGCTVYSASDHLPLAWRVYHELVCLLLDLAIPYQSLKQNQEEVVGHARSTYVPVDRLTARRMCIPWGAGSGEHANNN